VRVLTANPGSSSVKLAVVDDGIERETVTVDAASVPMAHLPLSELAGRWAPIGAAAVRFVHGGSHTESVLLDESILGRLAELVPLAPLHHQPLSLTMAEIIRHELDVPVVACFDTAFHAAMPEAATRYALPDNWVREFGLRRYGFHGLHPLLRACSHAEAKGPGRPAKVTDSAAGGSVDRERRR
jgi:acetate kinase